MGQRHRALLLRLHMLGLLCAVALMLPSNRSSAGGKTEVEEVLATKSNTDMGAPETRISLLEDEHQDIVLRAYGIANSGPVWHVLFLADGAYLVVIERPEGGDSFTFDDEIYAGCVNKSTRFFRKLAGGRVIGFYAIQSTFRNEVSGTKLIHEVFRFRRENLSEIGDYASFVKVAEKRIAARRCETASKLSELITLVRKH
jgi:hypothetical protein